jgi:hypothetical protein
MKVVYIVSLPVARENAPVGARLEVEDTFLPNEVTFIAPSEDVELYVVQVAYDPHTKSATVDLSFESAEERDDLEHKLDTETLALYEIDLEALLRLGWMPLMMEDLEDSRGDDAPRRKGSTH